MLYQSRILQNPPFYYRSWISKFDNKNYIIFMYAENFIFKKYFFSQRIFSVFLWRKLSSSFEAFSWACWCPNKHFCVIASKGSHHHNQTRLLFYIHWGGPKGFRRAPLYALIGECPMFQKRKEFLQRKKKEKGKKKACFWNLVFPNVFLMILSCSHQVPNGFFFMFPMFPIVAHFILYVLAKFLFFVKPYR